MATTLNPTSVPTPLEGVRYFEPGVVIFEEGASGDTAYIIESGQVEISVERGGQPVRLALLGPGEIFGEMALIDDRPRSASVRATSLVSCIAIDRAQIQRRLSEADVITAALLRLTLDRFRRLQRSLYDMPAAALVHAVGFEPNVIEAPRITYELARERLKFERELRTALDTNQFFLEYQPIVALADGSLAGFEALIRWRHPERGRITPNLFIDLAEEAGLIQAIDSWVVASGLSVLEPIRQECLAIGIAPPRLSLNLSGLRFVDADVVSELETMLTKFGVPAELITIEITESVLIRNPELALVVLQSLKKLGLSIALDDFGTGYSSLSYLQRFPIDAIKIDLSFVQRMQTNDTSLQIVRAIVGLARALDIKVIAEGIEVPVQARLLRDMGADFGQGWLFSRALPPEAARAYVLGNSAGQRVLAAPG